MFTAIVSSFRKYGSGENTPDPTPDLSIEILEPNEGAETGSDVTVKFKDNHEGLTITNIGEGQNLASDFKIEFTTGDAVVVPQPEPEPTDPDPEPDPDPTDDVWDDTRVWVDSETWID